MYFDNPWLLLLAVLVLVLWLIPQKIRVLPIASIAVVKESGSRRALRVIWKTAEKVIWTILFLWVVIIIGWPMKIEPHLIRKEKVRKICLVVDVSTSMSGEGVTSIKRILHGFVDKRRGDWQCLVVFSGNPGQEGGALVLQPLTPDINLMHQAIERIEVRMVGGYTAIGEGIWVGSWALREKELQSLEKKNIIVDLGRVRAEMKTAEYTYSRYLLGLLGKKSNEVMIVFTDGYYNTGLHPSVALTLARFLGIRMFLSVLDQTGPTGLSEETAQKRLEEMKRAALETKGGFFKGANYEEVAQVYQRIDQEIGKGDLEIEQKNVPGELYRQFVGWLPIFVALYIIMRTLFLRIRGRRIKP